MINCPYCEKEIDEYDLDKEYHGNGYENGLECYWDEYRAICPHCSKVFRYFDDYMIVGNSALRMEE